MVNLWTPAERYRLLCWLTFLIQLPFACLFLRWDRCVFLTDPPFQAVVGILTRIVFGRRRKTVMWTMDLYPEMLAASGILSERSLIYRSLWNVNRLAFKAVDGVVSLGHCQKAILAAYPPVQSKSSVIVPPWDDRAIPEVTVDQNRFIELAGLKGKRVALYAGNLGEGHIYEPILRLAAACAAANESEWVFVFVVRGSKKADLLKDSRGMDNVKVFDYQQEDLLPDVLWSADIHLITMNTESLGLVVPSKLYGALKTGAPVLFVGPRESQAALDLDAHEAGLALPVDASEYVLTLAFRQLADRGRAEPPQMEGGARKIARFVTGL